MLASNYSDNLHSSNINNSNEQIDTFKRQETVASSLDYLYQAITLIEQNKMNNSSLSEEKTLFASKNDDYTTTNNNNCTSSCCSCQKNMSKKRKKHNEANNNASQKEKQILSKYKKLKTSNYSNKSSVKHSVRNELRLNISSNSSSDAMTPVSLSSLSPQSVKSNISPIDSPFLNQQQSSAFNYYPIEMMPTTNLFPFYYTPFNNSAFSQQSQPTHLTTDPTYMQNLINTIYSLANYQQQLQATQSPNNLIMYSMQQQLHNQQVAAAPLPPAPPSTNIFNPYLIQPKVQAEPLVKSKLISYINEAEIENKVNEHFRRSLGSKYLKISHKLNRLNSGIRVTKPNVNTKLTKNEHYYYENDETFIEFSNDEQTNINSYSPASTNSVLSDIYSQHSHLLNETATGPEDDLIEDESSNENRLIYSPPLSSNC